ncbi:MAG: hypothetical protein KBC06_02780 [Candidatus Pacebacteria bacterium]|nr:hypothetical protein [Candidatus Paceibacterota bacterium]
MIKFIRIFLLVLIIIGLGLLATQKTWVPKLVDKILESEKKTEVVPEPTPVSQITYNNASTDLITVELPFPDAVTGKEFSVIGKARGTWFFEGSFPFQVLDKNGKVLVSSFATAEGEWMTENFVPFKATVKVPDSYIGPATLVIQKDNASGLPEHDASISFPITIEY